MFVQCLCVCFKEIKKTNWQLITSDGIHHCFIPKQRINGGFCTSSCCEFTMKFPTKWRRVYKLLRLLFSATAYGKGTYFAVNASYSVSYANLWFLWVQIHVLGSSADWKLFVKEILQCVRPPTACRGFSDRLYDSVVDNFYSPTMFIVFRDSSVYPKYLISFKWFEKKYWFE